jgi:chromosome segregation ATPase
MRQWKHIEPELADLAEESKKSYREMEVIRKRQENISRRLELLRLEVQRINREYESVSNTDTESN